MRQLKKIQIIIAHGTGFEAQIEVQSSDPSGCERSLPADPKVRTFRQILSISISSIYLHSDSPGSLEKPLGSLFPSAILEGRLRFVVGELANVACILKLILKRSPTLFDRINNRDCTYLLKGLKLTT